MEGERVVWAYMCDRERLLAEHWRHTWGEHDFASRPTKTIATSSEFFITPQTHNRDPPDIYAMEEELAHTQRIQAGETSTHVTGDAATLRTRAYATRGPDPPARVSVPFLYIPDHTMQAARPVAAPGSHPLDRSVGLRSGRLSRSLDASTGARASQVITARALPRTAGERDVLVVDYAAS